MSRMRRASAESLPRWFGSLQVRFHTPHHSLLFLFAGFLGWMGVVYAFGVEEAQLLPISTSSYIATYVLAMAAGVRLLAGAPRAGAFIALAACVLVLAFVGALLAWIVGVTAACLAYQAWAGRYPLNARSAIG